MEQALEHTRHTAAPGYALKLFGFLVGLIKVSSDSYQWVSLHSARQSFCADPSTPFRNDTVRLHSY